MSVETIMVWSGDDRAAIQEVLDENARLHIEIHGLRHTLMSLLRDRERLLNDNMRLRIERLEIQGGS